MGAMGATLSLVSCVLVLGQPTDRADWQMGVQLVSGLELVYSGTYVEEALAPGIQYQRTYRLETTAFVLETMPNSWQVAVMTALSLHNSRSPETKGAALAQPWSVRLELLEVDKQGHLQPRSGSRLLLPLSGPPTLESGAFVELPRSRVGRNHAWEVAEEGRPPRSWQCLGLETCQGIPCLKLQGRQQADDWEQPRADRTAWCRRDTVWLAPQLGVAFKVERIIERRTPARREPTHRSLVRYELESRLQYPGKLREDRRQEILKTLKLVEEANVLLRQPAQYRHHLEVLAKKISWHQDNHPPTPYRKALLNLQTRLENAHRGDPAPEQVEEEPSPLAAPVGLGQRAPDFVVSNLTAKDSVRLYRLQGRPVLLVFFNPTMDSGKQVLEFARALDKKYANNLAILALAVNDDAQLARKQHQEMRLPFPILAGKGLHLTFGVEATPRLVLLDAEGVMRLAFTGWGLQVPQEIQGEIQRCLHR